jgi:hypothetical protein
VDVSTVTTAMGSPSAAPTSWALTLWTGDDEADGAGNPDSTVPTIFAVDSSAWNLGPGAKAAQRGKSSAPGTENSLRKPRMAIPPVVREKMCVSVRGPIAGIGGNADGTA